MSVLPENNRIDLSSYIIKEKLAKSYFGISGDLYLLTNSDSSEQFLMKEIDLSGIPPAGKSGIYEEILFISQFKNENILSFLGFSEQKNKLSFITEYPGEILSDYLMRGGPITYEFLINLLECISSSIEFLEKHCDFNYLEDQKLEISPENIIITKQGKFKLCDFVEPFRLLRTIRNEQGLCSIDPKNYMHPELINNQNNIKRNYKHDFFSLGMIILKLIDPKFFQNFYEGNSLIGEGEEFHFLIKKIEKKIFNEIYDLIFMMVNLQEKMMPELCKILEMIKLRQKYKKIDDERNQDENTKKKDRDLFILKDQVRILQEQNRKLSLELEKTKQNNIKSPFEPKKKSNLVSVKLPNYLKNSFMISFVGETESRPCDFQSIPLNIDIEENIYMTTDNLQSFQTDLSNILKPNPNYSNKREIQGLAIDFRGKKLTDLDFKTLENITNESEIKSFNAGLYNIISSFDFSPNKKQNEKKNWFESFSQILGGMNKLEKLKMEISCSITDIGMKYLVDSLYKLKNLTEICFTFLEDREASLLQIDQKNKNNISITSGFCNLLKTFLNMETLRFIEINIWIILSEDIFDEICKLIQQFKNISLLKISFNRWGLDEKNNIIKKIEEKLKNNGIICEIKMSYHLPVISKFQNPLN